MPEKFAYETGARKYPARTGPDPSDDFSQDAAGNKPPAERGPTEKVYTKKRTQRPDEKEGTLERDHVSPSPGGYRGSARTKPN